MRIARNIIVSMLLAGPHLGCTPVNPLWANQAGTQSQLQIREIQTRTFSDCEPVRAMKVLVDVLQDDGFIVKNAVMELGLISATKELDVSSKEQEVFQSLLFGDDARWNKNAIIEATANVTASGNAAKIRVTFQIKTLNNRGEVAAVEAVADAKYYQEFFTKVDKGIFVQKQGL